MKFSLANNLDRQALRQSFERDRFLHIPDVLHKAAAEKLLKVLRDRTDWNLCFNDRGKHIDLAPQTISAMTGEQHHRLQQAVFAQAQNDFQYFYNNYPIFDAHQAGLNKGHPLHAFYEWLNRPEFLGFIHQITGMDDIGFADAQATRFMAGHFLKRHDDHQPGKNRRVAYIFNFTSDWQPDWGGYLQLLDGADHVSRGIKPVFNSLNILAVPQAHNVSFVAPYAAGVRLAVTGWLRAGSTD
ncbi:MAG: 2OG-Fe(II) oxygenase family protein [Pseudohongiella sp.]|uniref:2OG-Fe(II) oxygenase n=1 Tax=Pseudohongiella sp. TaxID=1979412 RepID=UPI0034A04DC5